MQSRHLAKTRKQRKHLMSNEVKVIDNQLVLSEQAKQILKEMRDFEITKQEMENKFKEVKLAVQKAMIENEVKSCDSEYVKITYVAPTQRVSVDTAKMKEEGIYDLYTKTSEVKASVRFTFK